MYACMVDHIQGIMMTSKNKKNHVYTRDRVCSLLVSIRETPCTKMTEIRQSSAYYFRTLNMQVAYDMTKFIEEAVKNDFEL